MSERDRQKKRKRVRYRDKSTDRIIERERKIDRERYFYQCALSQEDHAVNNKALSICGDLGPVSHKKGQVISVYLDGNQ